MDVGHDGNATAQRGRQFYIALQYPHDSPFRGMVILGREEIDAVLKRQKKEDTSITANIQGKETNVWST